MRSLADDHRPSRRSEGEGSQQPVGLSFSFAGPCGFGGAPAEAISPRWRRDRVRTSPQRFRPASDTSILTTK